MRDLHVKVWSDKTGLFLFSCLLDLLDPTFLFSSDLAEASLKSGE